MKKKLHAVEKNLSLISQHLNLANENFKYYPDHNYEFNSIIDKNVLFITCASKIKKKWHIDGWNELKKFFLKKKFHIFFTAGNSEELNYVNQIKGSSNSIILFNEDLLKVIEKIKSMHLVIGLDTGLTHVSNALGVPTVGLFINSSPKLTGLFGNPNSLNLLSNLNYKKDCLEILNFYKKIYK
jgi:heptosyltransferase-1